MLRRIPIGILFSIVFHILLGIYFVYTLTFKENKYLIDHKDKVLSIEAYKPPPPPPPPPPKPDQPPPPKVQPRVRPRVSAPAPSESTVPPLPIPPVVEKPKEEGPVESKVFQVEAVPVSRVPPEYPEKALRLEREGYVVMEFSIEKDGSVDEIRVVEGKPPGMFDDAAVAALKKWRYDPQMLDKDGVKTAVKRINNQVKLSFKLGL